MINSARVRVLFVGVVALAVIILVAVAVLVLQKRSAHYTADGRTNDPGATHLANSSGKTADVTVSPPLQTTPVPTASSPSRSSETLSTASPDALSGETADSSSAFSSEPGFVRKLNLTIPVVGVRAERLLDTFKDARSEGRVHDAIDIPAPAGTPVIAAADGEIIKLFQSDRGGTTIYQLSQDKKLVFYYAHLQRYAEGLTVGRFVRQGELMAYVGDSGNAGPGNYHLHFSVAIVADPKRYWEGTNINPYPLLRK